PLLYKSFIFDWNKIVNQDREPDAVAPLRFGDMLHIVGNPPTGAQRDDDIPTLHEPLEAASPGCHVDEIANRSLEYRKEKPRMADDDGQHTGEFAPKFRRRPHCLPRGVGARRVQICGNDRIEADRLELLGVQAEPAKPHASGTTIESLGFDKDLERHALQAGRITKMIKISEKILDFEPHDRLTVLADAMVCCRGFVG